MLNDIYLESFRKNLNNPLLMSTLNVLLGMNINAPDDFMDVDKPEPTPPKKPKETPPPPSPSENPNLTPEQKNVSET